LAIINIKPKKVVFILGFIIILLVFASVVVQLMKFAAGSKSLYGLASRFDLDGEGNIPNYFSSILLLFSAFLLAIIAAIKKKGNKPYAYHWVFLSIIFVHLSIDEMICIHESWIRSMRIIFDAKGIFYFAWVIPGLVVVLVLAAFFYRFLFNLVLKSRLLFMIAAIVYVGGVLGCELIGGWYVFHFGKINFTYNMIAMIEEVLEMTGIVLFIYALLEYMQNEFKEIQVQIKN